MSEWSGTSKRDIPVTVNRNGIVTDGPCFTHPSPDPVVSEAETEAGAIALFDAGLWAGAWSRANEAERNDARFKARACLTAALKVRTK